MRRWKLALAAAAAASALACAPSAGTRQDDEAGPPAPQFALKDLSGKTVRLRDLRPKSVLLNLWGVWCDPCQDSIQFYQSLYEQYAARRFEVVGVNEDEERDTVARYVRDKHVTYTVVLDPSHMLLRDLPAETLPTTVLVDRAGRIRGRWTGFDRRKAAEIEAAVKSLVGVR